MCRRTGTFLGMAHNSTRWWFPCILVVIIPVVVVVIVPIIIMVVPIVIGVVIVIII